MGECFLLRRGGQPQGDLPCQPENLQIWQGPGAMELQWSAPADELYQGVMVRRKVGSYPTGPQDGQLVYRGNGSLCTDAGLVAGQLYCYRLFAYGPRGQIQTSRCQAQAIAVNNKPLARCNVGDVVQLLEKQVLTNFVVAQQNYPNSNGGTLLLRQHCSSLRIFANKATNEYVASQVDNALERDYPTQLEAWLQPYLQSVDIPYTTGGTTHTLTTIARRVFALSLTEAGADAGAQVNEEGTPLPLFAQGDASRLAQNNGAPSNWWLRTPLLTNGTNNHYINKEGQPAQGVYSNIHGLRPALVLPGQEILVKPDGSLTDSKEE